MGLGKNHGVRLPPPDPLSTTLLYVGGVTMALDAALAPGTPIAAKIPAIAMTGIAPFIPITLMTLAGLIWVARAFRSGSSRAEDSGHAVARPEQPAREPFLTPYLKAFIVIMTVMIIFDYAMAIMNRLLPSAH